MDKSKLAEFRARKRGLNREMRDVQRGERLATAAIARAEQREKMTPEQLENEAKLDALYSSVFRTPEGETVLLHLSDIRPVVADMIKERISRHVAAAEPKSEPAAPAG